MGNEKEMGLAGISFEVFEGAIKRYGWVGKMTDDGMKEVSSTINLNLSDFEDNTTFVAKLYRAPEGFEQGNYHVEKILLLGFILCNHSTENGAARELWGVINPGIEDEIDSEKVRDMLKTIVYYCVDAQLQIEREKEEPDIDTMGYLQECLDKSPMAIDDVMSKLPRSVTFNDFVAAIPSTWYSSYRVRYVINPEKAKA